MVTLNLSSLGEGTVGGLQPEGVQLCVAQGLVPSLGGESLGSLCQLLAVLGDQARVGIC